MGLAGAFHFTASLSNFTFFLPQNNHIPCFCCPLCCSVLVHVSAAITNIKKHFPAKLELHWKVIQPASQPASSNSDQHFFPDGIPFATVYQPCHHHPHWHKSSLSSSSHITPSLTARSAACAHRSPSSRSVALRDVRWALGSSLRHAGRKQKPEKWRSRLGKITHCCLTLRQGCLCRMLVGKQGESGD